MQSSCGICLNSVKTGQGKAIYTAECTHAFHFPCIADYVRKHGNLICPVCNISWKEVPLLAAHKNNSNHTSTQQNDVVVVDNNAVKPHSQKTKETSSPIFTTKHIESPRQLPQKQTKQSDASYRSYDDDEPLLLSPTAGGRIIPIPEAEEEEDAEHEDDVEEFQGFFTNAKSSSETCTTLEKDSSRTVQVKLIPECAIISVSRTHETYALLLKVKAPPPARGGQSQRAPIDLVTVLDVGGSMSGAKLHMLKRAMRLVISSLSQADRLSIVAFSASSKRLMPLRRMTAQGQRFARRIVDRLVSGQGNCVGDALRKATKVLEDRRERNPVASVMLLSDGQDEKVQSSNPNSKNQRKPASHVSSTRFAHIEIPVHAFGFGRKTGFSNEPGEDAFAKCVGGLLSVVVQDLRIQLGFQSGSSAAEISGIYLCGGRTTALSSGCVRLGDLYAEEERELLVELKVPTSACGVHHVMKARCLYKDPVSQEIVSSKEQSLIVPPPQGSRSERLRNFFITTRAIAESRRLVEHSDMTSAHHLLASARALLVQAKSSSAEEHVRALEAELAELHWRTQNPVEQIGVAMQERRGLVDDNGEPLTPTSAWRAAEMLAKVAIMKKSLNRVSDLHGFENARF